MILSFKFLPAGYTKGQPHRLLEVHNIEKFKVEPGAFRAKSYRVKDESYQDQQNKFELISEDEKPQH